MTSGNGCSKACTGSSCPVGSGTAAWRARCARRGSRASARCHSSGCAWACRCCASSWRGTCSDSNDPNSTEFNLFTRYPIIDLLPEQRDVEDKGATMRLGVYPCQLQPGTLAGAAYDEPIVFERHRHRYEFNNTFRERAGERWARLFGDLAGWPPGRDRRAARSPVHARVAVPSGAEEPANRPHPLFRDFVAAAAALAGEQLPLDDYALSEEAAA